MIELRFLSSLKKSKNLLAFSGGVDSTALYFLLKENGISFDIAIVNYNIRKQSKLEISRAESLSFYDQRVCFVYDAPNIDANFECNARNIRYTFFETLIEKYSYDNLILAHQLNDSLEWFLMQFCKGTDVLNMSISPIYQKNINGVSYNIVRPLIDVSRSDILKYLSVKNIFYFNDFSNNDFLYKRNYFRKKFSNSLLKEYEDGIRFSLSLIQNLYNNYIKNVSYGSNYFIFESGNFDLFCIDNASKKLNYLLSKNQKFELTKNLNKEIYSFVFGNKIVVEKMNNKIYVFLNDISDIRLTKAQKEFFRINKIPIRFRKYMIKNNIKLNI